MTASEFKTILFRILHRIRASRLLPLFAAGLLMAACGPSRSYVVLVTATPFSVVAPIGGGDTAPSSPAQTDLPPTPIPTYAATPTFIPTPNPTRAVIVDPSQDQIHVVQPGDTLNQIALLYGVSVESIIAANAMLNPDDLSVGQTLIIPTAIQLAGPDFKVIPDSELVYGPALRDFRVAEFLAGRDCYLCSYSEVLDGRAWTGAEIVERVALEQSINPRLLLALLEYHGGWITRSDVPEEAGLYPMNYLEYPAQIYGLYEQLNWAGKMLNTGYYGWRQRGLSAVVLADGTRVGLDPTLNAGTAGVQLLLAQTRNLDGWYAAVGHTGLFAAYVSLFGDPFQYAVEPLIPPDLTQPRLSFPWAAGEAWYYTGGPHGGWGSGSAWAALDFVSGEEENGCEEAEDWARAVADGVIARSNYGIVILDLDGDNFMGTGWTIVYLHLASDTRAVVEGQAVRRGDPIGHPACEGGVSYATHLHFARRYNGEWIAADCSSCLLTAPAPQFNLDGWLAYSFGREYDGSLINGDDYREACTCRDPVNTIILSE